MKEILLANGMTAKVDDRDFVVISLFRWTAIKSRAKNRTLYYAITSQPSYTSRHCRTVVYMHRMVMHSKSKLMVDHIDGDGLNNTRANLRFVTNRDNQLNRHSKVTSKYPGVSYSVASDMWIAQISVGGVCYHLGRYTDEYAAAKAYRNAYMFVTRDGIIEPTGEY